MVRCLRTGIWEGADGSRYEGSYVNGQWQGKGKYDAADGTCFEGMWSNGLMHGTGTCSDASGTYSGEWKQGERHGRGHLLRTNGEECDPTFGSALLPRDDVNANTKTGLCHRYLGEWHHDEQTGVHSNRLAYVQSRHKSITRQRAIAGAVEKAVIVAPDGCGGEYTGMFLQGLPTGKGKLEQDDGGCYEVRRASALISM